MTYPPPSYPSPSPYPMQPPPPPKRAWWKATWVPIAGAAVVALLIGSGIGSSAKKTTTKTVAGPTVLSTTTETATVQATVTATPTIIKTTATHIRTETVTYTPPPPTQYPEGTYVIGTDIQPGTYHSDGSPDCYWALLNSLDTTDIADNHLGGGPQTIQVSSSNKALLIQGACTFGKA